MRKNKLVETSGVKMEKNSKVLLGVILAIVLAFVAAGNAYAGDGKVKSNNGTDNGNAAWKHDVAVDGSATNPGGVTFVQKDPAPAAEQPAAAPAAEQPAGSLPAAAPAAQQQNMQSANQGGGNPHWIPPLVPLSREAFEAALTFECGGSEQAAAHNPNGCSFDFPINNLYTTQSDGSLKQWCKDTSNANVFSVKPVGGWKTIVDQLYNQKYLRGQVVFGPTAQCRPPMK
jgi:hypothetical protein